MSAGPRPVPAPRPGAIRERARRQARALPSGLLIALGAFAAVAAMTVFVVLDYGLGQPPHRIIKILLGVVFVGTMVLRPWIGLLLFPVLTPFLPWMPNPVRIPGLNPLNVMLVTVFMAWAVMQVLNRRPLFRSGRMGALLGVLVLVAVLALVRGAAFPSGYEYQALDAGIELFRGVVTLSVYFIAFYMARGEKDRKALAWAIVIALLAESIVTIAYGRTGRGGRAVGSIGQSNELGTFLALYIMIAASLFFAVRNAFARVLLAAAVVLGCFATMLSVSRAAILSIPIGLGLIAWKSSRVLTFVLVAAMLTSPWWTPDYVKQRILSTHEEVEGSDEAELEGGAQLRVDTWRAIGQVVTDHPLDGVGFAGLKYVLPQTGDAMGVEVKDSSHNTFLRFLAEMGILGLVLFVLLLWRCWRLGMEGFRRGRSRFDRQLALGFAAAALVLAIGCAFGDRFFNIMIAGNFWIACALVDDMTSEARGSTA